MEKAKNKKENEERVLYINQNEGKKGINIKEGNHEDHQKKHGEVSQWHGNKDGHSQEESSDEEDFVFPQIIPFVNSLKLMRKNWNVS